MGLSNFVKNRRGQGLVEYALLVAGVAFVATLAVSVLGKKTSDMIATYAALVPGSSQNVNDEVLVTALFQMTNTDGQVQLDMAEIRLESHTSRLNTALQPTGGELADYIIETRVD